MRKLLDDIINKKSRISIGLISGTSLDGIDSCIVEIEGVGRETKFKLIEFITVDYSVVERKKLEKICSNETATLEDICFMNTYLGNKFADAAISVCKKAGISTEDIDFISSHGQTIYHMPHKGSTFQIGELANIAGKTGCITVGDFRPSDMAYGGQGAPLVPFVDYILFSNNEKGRIMLNLGGIANITVLPKGCSSEDVFAFDTGPANLLIDAITKIITNGELDFDLNSEIAMTGSIDEKWLDEIIANDRYLYVNPPKSTGREYYNKEYAMQLYNNGLKRNLRNEDILATITAYTAKTVCHQIDRYVKPVTWINEIYIGGGGAHNKMVVNLLEKYSGLDVYNMDELGLPADAKEAVAFAVLGNQFLFGKTNNIPGATGANREVIMGKLVIPSR